MHASDLLFEVPRVALTPFYLTSELLLRRPIGWVVVHAERDHWASRIADLFTFGEDRNVGVFPTAFIDFGFRPSVGLYVFWNEAFVSKNAVRVHASTWGSDWLSVSLADRLTVARGHGTLGARASFLHRPDYIFAGLGPSTRQGDVTRYSSTRIEGKTTFTVQLWRSSRLNTEAGVRSVRFGEGHYLSDPGLLASIDQGRIAAPPGLDGYTAAFSHVELALDSRDRDEPRSGVRAQAFAEQGTDVRQAPGSSWLRWGGTLGGFVDVTGQARIVSLTLTAQFADPLRGGAVPFTEQIGVGGEGPMRGFLPGRLTDRSAAVATLQYEWPVWVWLDGVLHLAAGNVFGTHLDELSGKKVRFSSGLGFRTTGSADARLELLVAGGTDTIEQGARLSSFRFYVGGTHGF